MEAWNVVGASVTGTGHEKAGMPCQDSHRWCILPDGILLAAVADGAGSAEFGAQGAVLAVQTALETLTASWQGTANVMEGLQAAVAAARHAVECEADALGVELRELASTLLLVAVTPELAAAAQIGDGAVVLEDDRGSIHALTTPQGGEHANETTFLISPGALENAVLAAWQGKVRHLALFTDGLQRLALKMPEGTPHAPFFTPLFRFVETMINDQEAGTQLENFLRSPRVTARADDDLTLLLAARK